MSRDTGLPKDRHGGSESILSESFQQILFSEKEEPSRVLRAEVQIGREGLGVVSRATWGQNALRRCRL